MFIFAFSKSLARKESGKFENRKTFISIVIPSFNEAENIPLLIREITNCLPVDIEFELLFVDDGSTDDTALELKEQAKRNPRLKYLLLSKNFGHQHALKAGLDYARGDAVICMDGDLQHPPSLLSVMIEKWRTENYDVV